MAICCTVTNYIPTKAHQIVSVVNSLSATIDIKHPACMQYTES